MQYNKRKFFKNVSISLLSQIFSLLVSVLINLIVPKFIDEYQYAYWQSYVMYVGYVGIFHFGILDGMLLKYAKYNYEQLDKEKIRSQFVFLIIIDVVIAILIAILGTIFFHNGMAKIILIFVAFGVVSKNIFTYACYTFQMTNRINYYVRLIIFQRSFYAFSIIILLLIGFNKFYYFCIIDLLADIISVMALFSKNKKLYIGKLTQLNENILELKDNIHCGIQLLVANWVSMLLVGEAKILVQFHWDTLTFGKVSFSFSISNLFLTFVTAVSIVLFPMLKRIDEIDLPQIYQKLRNSISPILFGILLLYFPGVILLEFWIPNYRESLAYLGVLLPIIVFTSKLSLITNNYLKAYRKENEMLKISLTSVMFGSIIYIVAIYLFNSVMSLLLCVVITLMFESIYSEVVVSKIIKIPFVKQYVVEAGLVIVFMVSTFLNSILAGFGLYLASFGLYLIFNSGVVHFKLSN